jgi:hypothetical protein
VQDHARRTGTHGEMISSDLHGAEEPTRWMLRPQQEDRDRTEGFAQEKRRTFHRGTLAELYLGGCVVFIRTLALEGPGHHAGGP